MLDNKTLRKHVNLLQSLTAETERLRDKLVEYMNETQTKAAEVARLRELLQECWRYAVGAPIGVSSDLWERVGKALGHD